MPYWNWIVPQNGAILNDDIVGQLLVWEGWGWLLMVWGANGEVLWFDEWVGQNLGSFIGDYFGLDSYSYRFRI